MFRFAIMGAGNIANKFSDAVHLTEDCSLAAVASKSMTRACGFAKAHNIAAYYDSYEEMLQKERLDCVYIATTPDTHFPLAKLCLQYGVPVLCEKAMFMNSRDAAEVLGMAKAQSVFVMEAMWSRFLPAINTARKWIDEGCIGEAACLQIDVGHAFERSPESRHFSPALGGGSAFDLTVYNYELATYFFGDAYQKMEVQTNWDEHGVDVSNSVQLQYDGRLALLLSSCISMLNEKLVVTGSRGRLEIPHAHYGDEVFVYDGNGVLIRYDKDVTTINGFTYEIAEVIRCIHEGSIESPVVPHSLTLQCAKLFDEIHRQRPKI